MWEDVEIAPSSVKTTGFHQEKGSDRRFTPNIQKNLKKLTTKVKIPFL